jgi:hypothetical protein
MLNYVRMLAVLVSILLAGVVTFAQSAQDGADTSGAEAAIQAKAMQNSAKPSTQTQQAFPALKAESCKVAVPYVENDLAKEWDQCVADYHAKKNGMAQIQKIKSDLLSDSWWRASSGADVVREINTLCNLFNDVLGAMTPEGAAVGFAKDFGTEVKRQSAKIFEVVQYGGGAVDAIREGTDNLAIFAMQEGFQQTVGGGRLFSIVKVLQDVQKDVETRGKAEEYKQAVRKQLHDLDEMLSKYGNDIAEDQQRKEAIESITEAVISACNQGQPIQTLPDFASAGGQTSDSGLQSSSSQPPPVVPWWVTALSSYPVATAVRPAQTRPTSKTPTTQSGGASSCPPCTGNNCTCR